MSEVVECYVVRHPNGLEPFSNHKSAMSFCRSVGSDNAKILRSVKELSEFVATPMMVAAYNQFAIGQGKNKVIRFSDKDVAAKRTWEVLVNHAATKKGIHMDDDKRQDIARKIVDKANSLVDNPTKRRKFSRDSIIVKLVEANPRRAGTAGHKSWELLQADMTIGQFVEAGGRMNDLLWDVDKGNLKLVEPQATAKTEEGK